MLFNIEDTYAHEYGWTKDYIWDNVYVDEYFYKSDLIDNRKRQHYQWMTNIIWLAQSDDKDARQEFLDRLMCDSDTQEDMPVEETDIETIKRIKQKLYGK